jgi:hypothetical protein
MQGMPFLDCGLEQNGQVDWRPDFYNELAPNDPR